jgi:hypothetical protein
MNILGGSKPGLFRSFNLTGESLIFPIWDDLLMKAGWSGCIEHPCWSADWRKAESFYPVPVRAGGGEIPTDLYRYKLL